MFDWFKKTFGNPRERWLLARREGRWDDAVAALRETQRTTAGGQMAVELVDLLVNLGRLDEARAALEAARAGPRNTFELERAAIELEAASGAWDVLAKAHAALDLLPKDDMIRAIMFGNLARAIHHRRPTREVSGSDAQHAFHVALSKVELWLGARLVERDESPVSERVPASARPLFDELDRAREALERSTPPVEVTVGDRKLRLTDTDPTSRASFEVIDLERGLVFVPFAEVARATFEDTGYPFVKVRLEKKAGGEARGFYSLVYHRSVELARHVVDRNMTVWRAVTATTRLPLGIRDFEDHGERGKAIVSPFHLIDREWRFA